MTDDVLFEEGEYRDAIRLAATDAGHAILDTLTDTDRGERVTMEVLDDATPSGTDTPGRVKEMQRAALIVERRGPDTDPYFEVTGPGRTAHEHVTAGVRALQNGEQTGEDESNEMVEINLRLSKAFLEDIDTTWRDEGFDSRDEFLRHVVRDAVKHPAFTREGWKQIAAGEHDLRTGEGDFHSR